MVGILTFHRAANYGAVLQCYALQQALDKLKIENEIIDYRCSYIQRHYSPIPSVSFIHIRRFIYELCEAPIKFKVRLQFDKFLKLNLRLSDSVNKSQMKSFCRRYNTIITGSDQVWNLAITGEDTTYFLDFSTKGCQKISYAASIGPKEVKEKYIKIMQPFLQLYDIISIREEAAINSIQQMTGRMPRVDTDPTVLMDISEWNYLVTKSKLKLKNKKYIFLYLMQDSPELIQMAKMLAQKYKLVVYSILMMDSKEQVGIDMRGSSVEDFLYLIHNAEFVCTNSFHGIMFSIRFHKKFFWAYQSGKNMSNPRFDMLIHQYGIDCRCFIPEQEILEYQDMHYESVDKMMSIQRRKSLQYLKEGIKS